MLKHTVFVCLICSILIALTNCQNQPEQSHKIAEYFSKKCYSQTANYTYYTELSNEFAKFVAYFENSFALIPNRRTEFCEHERQNLNHEFHVVMGRLQPCLPTQEKYLPEFLRTSFKEFVHFLCHDNGEYMRRLFSPQNQQCRQSLESNVTSKITTCFRRIFKPRSGYITQQDLCDDISVAEKCFATVLEEKCPTSNSYKDLSRTFFRYISKPCSGCISQINMFLLILSVVLSYLFSKK